MPAFGLTLGPVAFAGFEVPSSITLGGRQRLAIHKLPGGIRIIDALGPDPADLAWSGIFTGPDAGSRARTLDVLRIAGLGLALTWDAFLYTVIIESFEADYRSPWWIPYRLSCSVLRDEAAAAILSIASLAPSIDADLALAGPLAAAAAATASLPGAAIAGTATHTAASQALAASLAGFDAQITAAEPAIQSQDVLAAASACGQLAQLAAARAYAARAARNLAAAST